MYACTRSSSGKSGHCLARLVVWLHRDAPLVTTNNLTCISIKTFHHLLQPGSLQAYWIQAGVGTVDHGTLAPHFHYSHPDLPEGGYEERTLTFHCHLGAHPGGHLV